MLGNWLVVNKIANKFYTVKCDLCGFETQRVQSKLKLHHRCPSIVCKIFANY